MLNHLFARSFVRPISGFPGTLVRATSRVTPTDTVYRDYLFAFLRFPCAFALILLLFLFPTFAALDDFKPSHVVVISLDGARPDAILQAETPNIQALAARGATSWTAQTVFPPATIPGHASMLTGLDVSEHGVDWNDSSAAIIETSTFLLKTQAAGYRVAMVVGKEKFSQFRQSDAIDYTFAREGDRSVVDIAIQRLQDGDEVLFVHLPNPDYFGHSAGWMSDTYLFELRNTDAQVGRILAALDALHLTEETLVILTADHGGHDREHGQNTPDDMTIPWIIAGPGVVAGSALDAVDVHVTDTAQTVLWALGLPLPPSELGRPIYEAFGMLDSDIVYLNFEHENVFVWTHGRRSLPHPDLDLLLG
jgi:hypothetical protein